MIATYRPQAGYRKGMLFAVTLPGHAQEHDGIREIQADFKRRFARANWLMLLLLVPMALLHAWPAYQTIYYLLWMCAYITVTTLPFRRAFRETLALKREND